MQLTVARDIFYRLYIFILALNRWRDTGQDRLFVNQYRATAALSSAAAVLGPRQAQLLAKHAEQIAGAGHCQAVLDSVDANGDCIASLRHGAPLSAATFRTEWRCSSRRRFVP